MARIVNYPRSGIEGARRFVPSWRLVLGLATAAFLLGVIAFSVLYSQVAVPDPNKLVTAQASVVYWSDGKTELGRFSEVNRQSVPLAQVPEHVRQAVLAAEDRSFYSNAGVSPRGIARAVWVKVRGGSTQGGSTITQQYVKNYFLTQDQTYSRKIKEFVIALKIEQRESKQQILENYLNTIYFGRGAYGIERASQAYFRHPASKLTVAEGAVLASVLRSPGLYDPVKEKERAQQRMEYVLDGMVSEGYLEQAQRDKVRYPKIAPRRSANSAGGTNGYLLRAVQEELKNKVGLSDAQIDQGGLRVVSTFERKAQAAAVEAIADELPKDGASGVRAGLAAVRPGDGAVLAMYGGPDQVKQPLNAATQSVLQAGSTFKPFTLAAALESGGSLRSRYSGADDMQFPGVDDPIDNFGDSSYGRIDLVKATENSVNTVYVALNIDVGPQKTVDAAVAAGLPKDTAGLEANISNVLGTASPHVLDMADAYATFAGQGMQAPAYTVRSVTSSVSEVSYRAKVAPKRVFSEDTMADLTHALERVATSGSGSYAGANLDRPVAGKTGTSSSNRSAWFAGYTPQIAAVVGIYREKDGSPVSLKGLGGRSEVTGGSFPVRIWTAFMGGALEGAKVEQFPDPVFGGTSNAPEPVAPPTTDEPETPTQTPSPTASTPPPTTTPPTTPTEQPTELPTEQPTEQPTVEPEPTVEPTPAPTVEPPAPTTSEEPQDPPAEPPAEPTATDAGAEPLADAAVADPPAG